MASTPLWAEVGGGLRLTMDRLGEAASLGTGVLGIIHAAVNWLDFINHLLQY